MKKKLYSIIYLFLLAFKLQAQVNYNFVAVSSPYNSINGTIVAMDDLTGYGAAEEGHKNNLPIGFAFNYNGSTFNTIGVSANGFAYFGTINDADAANVAYINGLKDLMLTSRPILAPFWEDAKYGDGNKISYLTTGIAPNRIFILQWTDMIIGWDYSNPTPTPSLNMQVKLYEGSNIIEFAYNQITGGLVGSVGSDASGGASIGLSALATGTNNFLSLSNSGSSPSASSVSESSTIALRPATDQLYKFTPISVAPVTFANFKAVKKNAVANLTWTTFTEINNKGFEVEKSLDGKTFFKIGFLSSFNADGFSNTVLNYSFNDTKMLAVNSYYRLKQIDIDGKFWYSPIAIVKGLNVIGTQIGSLFPNPANSNLSMLVQSIQTEKVNINIADLLGRNLIHHVYSITAGDNLLSINIAELPPGVYLIKVNAPSSTLIDTKKFIKQ